MLSVFSAALLLAQAWAEPIHYIGNYLTQGTAETAIPFAYTVDKCSAKQAIGGDPELWSIFHCPGDGTMTETQYTDDTCTTLYTEEVADGVITHTAGAAYNTLGYFTCNGTWDYVEINLYLLNCDNHPANPTAVTIGAIGGCFLTADDAYSFGTCDYYGAETDLFADPACSTEVVGELDNGRTCALLDDSTGFAIYSAMMSCVYDGVESPYYVSTPGGGDDDGGDDDGDDGEESPETTDSSQSLMLSTCTLVLAVIAAVFST